MRASIILSCLLLTACAGNFPSVDEFNIGMEKDELIRNFGEPHNILRVPEINTSELGAGMSRQFLDQLYTEIWQYHGRGPIYNSNGLEKYGKVTIGAVFNDGDTVAGVGWQEGHN